MSFFFQDFFGGMPHGHMGGEEEDNEPVDTNKAYEVLGVSKTADENEIKNAYKKRARELHPDKHPDEREKYEKMFQELQHAYDVLKDPEKRKLYDKFGEKGVKQAGGGGSGSDLFGLFNRQKGEDSGVKKSPAIKRVLEVTLEDLYKGAMKEFEIERATAGSNSAVCDRCNGDGVITAIQRMGMMMIQQRRECPKCEGQGYQLETSMVTLQVHIPVGGKNGESVTLRGEGHRYPNHAPGDVTFQLKVLKHETFTRQGADLGMNATISLREALCGYTLRIKHVNGHTLVVTPPRDVREIVQPGSLKRVFTYGMPQRYSPHVKGHLYIVMEVQLPLSRSLSNKQIQQLKSALPNQTIEQDENKEEDEEMKSNNNTNTTKNTTKTSKGEKEKKSKKSKAAFKKGFLNKKKKDVEEEPDEDVIEVECHEVEGKPQATPAAAKGAHDEDEEERDGVPCQQM